MSGTGPNNNNNHNNNGQMNPQNFLLQQQFAQQQQQGNTFQQGGFAGANAQQQRMLQMQLQQQQMKLQQMQSKSQQQQQPGTRSTNSAMPNNPLAPAPATLNRGNMTASNAVSVAPPLGRMNSSATTGGSKTKGASKLGRAGSNAIPGPPGLMKATTSSMSIANIANNNTHSSEQQTQQLLTNCDWKDRTMWVSRQLLGGNATNGFLRATATVQRIKRQRARQTAQSKKKAEAEEKGEDGAGATPEAAAAAASKEKEKEKAEAKKRDTPDQASEEILKKEIMNPRTAKKLKQELEAGLSYCVTLQNAIRTIIMEMDPQIAVFTPLPLSQGGEIPRSAMLASASMAGAAAMSFASMPMQKAAAKAPPVQAQEISQPKRRASEANAASAKSTATQASPGGAGGSTLRKNRKKKLPPSTEKSPELAEFDAAGKRSFSKKEHTFRLFEVIRFRALKAGDFVAARVSSRDLWILARVQRDFPGFSMPPNDFLKLSEARRDGHFREKVAIKDVEESGTGGISMVPRNLVLPLPRTFSEAAEWCQRSKKGSRVYAMYPHTTSLYSATVIDNTTYCRQDDDIIVVEFDGDEADPTGVLPKYHIPARFVTLVPREFPAAQTNSKKRKSVTNAQASLLPNAANTLGSPQSVKRESFTAEGLLQDDGLGGMVSGMNFDDLNMSTDSLDDFGFDFSEA